MESCPPGQPGSGGEGDRLSATGRRRAKAGPAREAAAEREHLELQLDEALMQTFPASDPIALKACGSIAEGSTADPVPHGSGMNDGRAAPALPRHEPARRRKGRLAASR